MGLRVIGEFHKQPAEKRTIAVEFSADLDTGETLSTSTVTATDEATGQSASAILNGTAVISGTKVVQGIQAGTDGGRYLVHFQVSTSAGGVIEHEVRVAVEEV